MAEPQLDEHGRRILDITPENFRRTNTGAGKGDARGRPVAQAYRDNFDSIFYPKKETKSK